VTTAHQVVADAPKHTNDKGHGMDTALVDRASAACGDLPRDRHDQAHRPTSEDGGGTDALGAIGLIVPSTLGIAPLLTPLAAVGLVLTMVGA
jgi:hypothetical protein